MAIYLDHAATTPLRAEVLEAMLPYLTDHFGNPSSLHAAGRRARQGLDESRETIAALLGAKPREIVFTSGATENTTLAVAGLAWAGSARGRHLVTTTVEHRAVLAACGSLERHGFEVTYVPVDRYGQVDPVAVAEAIGPHTTTVVIGYANNEVGTIQPIAEIGALCRERGIRLYVDATQAAAALPLDVDALQVDLLGISGHKIEGPKGVGALFVRQGTNVIPQQVGGSQERQRRAGTENVAGAVGLATALQLVRGAATAPKSNAALKAYGAARAAARETGSLMPPAHILNAPTKMMKQLGYGSGYEYDHDAEGEFSGQNYFPDGMERQAFYEPKGLGREGPIREKLVEWAKRRAERAAKPEDES